MENQPANNIQILLDSIESFKKSFNLDMKKLSDTSIAKDKKAEAFNEILSGYYEIVIDFYKKLSTYNKKFLPGLIETYVELWEISPKNRCRNYFTPYLYDLSKFLFSSGEFEMLAFFYNLMIFSKEIPFIEYKEGTESFLSDMHIEADGEDPFYELREADRREKYDYFDSGYFDYEYDRFFSILKTWQKRTSGYHTKDEIYFMAGLFILDEIIERIEINEKTPVYEEALKYLKKAINNNPLNPRYFYEYARCLKNSGKTREAENFFRKAFDLNRVS